MHFLHYNMSYRWLKNSSYVISELNNNVNYTFPNDWTPLMYTCYHGQPAMADYLLERNADPNAHAGET